MNGTGTQADPYQVTTVEEFVNVINNLGNSNSYAKLMNDIDFNNSDYINLDNTLRWKCKYFDGQNHKISNIYTDKGCCFNADSAAYELFIENLIIEAVVLNYDTNFCCLFITPNAYSTTFNNCDFRVKINDNNKTTSKFIARGGATNLRCTYFNNCIFNIDQYVNTGNNKYLFTSIWERFYFNYCEFNINLINLSTTFLDYETTDGTSSTLFYNSASGYGYTLKFCALFINIYNNIETGQDKVLIQLNNMDDAGSSTNGFQCYNSYIIIQSKGKYPTLVGITAGVTCTGTCFYDKDISGPLVYGDPSSHVTNLYGLTTAQCKDPEYLESIGFFIAY